MALLAGCGAGHARPPVRGAAPQRRTLKAPPPAPREKSPAPLALVTAETENRLVIVNLRTGAIAGRVALPAGPEYVAAEPGLAVVVSSGAGQISLLEGPGLRRTRTWRGFGSPHIVELSPDGRHAYVTDDQRGTLSVIALSAAGATATLAVGAGAHHLASSPDQRRVWIALGEAAQRIVTVDTADIGRPRVVGSFDPGFPAHDLAFSPDGRRVWISSAGGPDVSVFRAADHRLLFRVPVGRPPQHILFAGADVYLTSGYGGSIEKVTAATGRVVSRAPAPYGSFELDAADGFVVTASLLDGELAIYTPELRRLRVRQLAPETRDVAISRP